MRSSRLFSTASTSQSKSWAVAGEELFAREEDVSARVAVVGELECQPRLGAERRVAAKAHGERDLVADGEVHAERAVGQ